MEEYSISRVLENTVRQAPPAPTEVVVPSPPLSPQSSANVASTVRKLRGPPRAASETSLRDLVHRMKHVPKGNRVDEDNML